MATRIHDHEEKMTFRIHALLASALLALAACAPVTSATSYRSLPPKASSAEIQVFTESRPDRPFEELGLIEVKTIGFSSMSGYGKLIAAAKERAAQMGADAILVTRRPVESTTTNGGVTQDKRGRTSQFNASTTTTEEPRISVVAIVWTAAQ